MDVDFINKYIEKLSNQVGELSKLIVFKDAQIEYLDEAVKRLEAQIPKDNEKFDTKDEDPRKDMDELPLEGEVIKD